MTPVLFQPDNILGVSRGVSRGGKARLKLADFGTAKLLDEDKVRSHDCLFVSSENPLKHKKID